MKRYYFELTDRSYNDLGAFIPDGYSKEVAVRQAKRWMAENSIVLATLIVNSLRTSNVLDVIDIDMENIKSLDPLLYSHLTHQKYIRIK